MYVPAATHDAMISPRRIPTVSAFARTELGAAIQIVTAAARKPANNKPPAATTRVVLVETGAVTG
jgi:hypothetical protein